MQYGVGLVDLNLRAQLALYGLTESPEKDIAILLRSAQPIEAATRSMLAEALEGKSKSLQLHAKGRLYGKAFRSVEAHLRKVRIGRLFRVASDASREIKLKDFADAYNTSPKSIENWAALANAVDSWIKQAPKDHAAAAEAEDFQLELAFLYAKVTRTKPEDALKSSLHALSELFERYRKMREPAFTALEDLNKRKKEST